MTRPVSARMRDALEAPFSSEVLVFFATIDHPDFIAPIRVNSDLVDYSYNNAIYIGCGFALSLLTDDEALPKAQASIPNVDRRIGEAVLALRSAPSIKIELLSREDFDDSTPRQPIGTPIVEYSAPQLFLANVTADASVMTADIVGFDLVNEPWPAIRSTHDRLPALYK